MCCFEKGGKVFSGVSGLCVSRGGGGVAEEVESINWLAAGGGARGGCCGSERTVIPPNVPYREATLRHIHSSCSHWGLIAIRSVYQLSEVAREYFQYTITRGHP